MEKKRRKGGISDLDFSRDKGEYDYSIVCWWRYLLASIVVLNS